MGSFIPTCAHRPLLSFLSLGFIVLLAGCGSSNQLPVTGQVLMGGTPIVTSKEKTASVSYHPDAAKGNKATSIAVGPVNESGRYTLLYDGKTGVPAGWYKVTVTYAMPSDPKNIYSIPLQLINRKYTTPQTTDLSIEVKPGPPAGHYDLTVTK